MFNQQVYILNTFRIILDALCIILAGYGAKYGVMYYVPDVAWHMEENYFLASILIVMILNNYLMGVLGMYGDRKYSGFYGIILPASKSIVLCFTVLAGTIFVLHPAHYPRSFLILFAFFSLILIICIKHLTLYYNKFRQGKGYNVRNVLIVANSGRGEIVKKLLDSQVSWGHKVVGLIDSNVVDPAWSLDNLPEIIKQKAIDEVFFAFDGNRSVDLSAYLDFCRQVGVAVKILPALWQPETHQWSIDTLQGVPFFTMHTTNFDANGIMYKRIMDLCGGTVGFLIFLLLYPFVAVALKMDSPGPVLFKQKRVGQNGRVFGLYKFRSMCQDAEARKQELMDRNEMNGLMFKMTDDPRITKVGRFLRSTSLDEFPQFINVLKGEMSLVGTRPPTLDEVEKYQSWHLKRIAAKPGITGLWQVSGRNKINDFDEVVKLDCRYLDQWRFSDDVKILFRTVAVVLKRKGAV